MTRHAQKWVKVNAPIDEGVRGIVSALSTFPCLETIESCEGTSERPAWCCFRYGTYWEQPWRDLAEFVLDWLGPTLAKEVGDSANVRIQVTASGLIMGELSVRPGQARAVETCLRRLARSVAIGVTDKLSDALPNECLIMPENGLYSKVERRSTMTQNKAPKWTWTESADEVRYIQSINPKCPGEGFNNDPTCFAAYRDMQYKQMLHSGWPEHAGQILRSSWA